MLLKGQALIAPAFSYKETYETIRGITGVGKGNGPLIAFHDG